ncbi:MAG: type II toxin-antitoxin system PemK/MazF family toxin [Candidatus Bipolaricaulis sp.]|nr:type II toxin-antitoxin system PemK/MazF family toxin [Candidatus Bipolaricaulis sp.]
MVRAKLDPVVGSEQAGERPVLVVSCEAVNETLPIVTVLPLTVLKPGRRIYPSEVVLEAGVAGQPWDSIILAHQIRTISKVRLGPPYGAISSEAIRERVRAAIRIHLDL